MCAPAERVAPRRSRWARVGAVCAGWHGSSVSLRMKRREMADIIRKRFDKVESTYLRVTAHFEVEDIHRFRVEIKKLRALLRLLGEAKGKGKKGKLPKRLHKFYQLAGTIRNLQLQQERVRELRKDQGLPQAYLNLLNTEVATQMLVAGNMARNQLSLAKERKSILGSLPDSLRRKKRERYVREAAAQLETLAAIPPPRPDDTLHSIRKACKDLYYNRRYIEQEAVLELPSTLVKDNGMKGLTDVLGDFQDLHTALELLHDRYTCMIADGGERAILDALKQEWEERKRTVRDRINGLLVQTIHPKPPVRV